MRGRRVLARQLVVLTAVSTLVAGATGGVAGGSVGGQPSGPAIKIGMITDATGPFATSLGTSPDAARAAVKAVNKAGEVKLELVFCDAKTDANAAADCGRKMDSEGVVAMIGGVSTVLDAALPIIFGAGIPSVCNGTSGPTEATSPMSFPCDSSALTGGISYGRILKAAGATEAPVRLTGLATPLSSILYPPAEGQIAAAGLEQGSDIDFPAGTIDFAPTAAEIGTDTAAYFGGNADAAALLKAMLNGGADFKEQYFILSGILSDKEVKSFKSSVNGGKNGGVYLAYQVFPPYDPKANPGVAQFVKELKAAGVEDTVVKNSFSVVAWASVHVLADILAELPTVDSPTLLARLNQGGLIDFPPLQPFDWSKPAFTEGPFASFRIFAAGVLPAVIKNGKVIPLSKDFQDSTQPITFDKKK